MNYKDLCFFSLFIIITVIYSIEADFWIKPWVFIPGWSILLRIGCLGHYIDFLISGFHNLRKILKFSTEVDFQSDEWR